MNEVKVAPKKFADMGENEQHELITDMQAEGYWVASCGHQIVIPLSNGVMYSAGEHGYELVTTTELCPDFTRHEWNVVRRRELKDGQTETTWHVHPMDSCMIDGDIKHLESRSLSMKQATELHELLGQFFKEAAAKGSADE